MRATITWGCLAALGCGQPCPTRPLAESSYCSDDGCTRLSELSMGCIGSHTEQECDVGGATFVVTGGDDAARLYFDPDRGTLVAVQELDPLQREVADVASCEASTWFGEDLTGCTLAGDATTVPCDGITE